MFLSLIFQLCLSHFFRLSDFLKKLKHCNLETYLFLSFIWYASTKISTHYSLQPICLTSAAELVFGGSYYLEMLPIENVFGVLISRLIS